MKSETQILTIPFQSEQVTTLPKKAASSRLTAEHFLSFFQDFNLFTGSAYHSIIKYLGDDTMKIVIVKPGVILSGILRIVYNVKKTNT